MKNLSNSPSPNKNSPHQFLTPTYKSPNKILTTKTRLIPWRLSLTSSPRRLLNCALNLVPWVRSSSPKSPTYKEKSNLSPRESPSNMIFSLKLNRLSLLRKSSNGPTLLKTLPDSGPTITWLSLPSTRKPKKCGHVVPTTEMSFRA